MTGGGRSERATSFGRWLRSRRAIGVLSLVASLSTCLAFGQDVTLASLRPAIAREHPDVAWITVDELVRALRGARRPRLLDARTAAEYQVSHLADAARIDPDHPDLRSLGADRASPIVVYCSVGYRSAVVAESLQRAGFRDVKNLEGGIFAWANRGLPVVRAGRRVRDVHPYDATWGRLLRADYRTSTAR